MNIHGLKKQLQRRNRVLAGIETQIQSTQDKHQRKILEKIANDITRKKKKLKMQIKEKRTDNGKNKKTR